MFAIAAIKDNLKLYYKFNVFTPSPEFARQFPYHSMASDYLEENYSEIACHFTNILGIVFTIEDLNYSIPSNNKLLFMISIGN